MERKQTKMFYIVFQVLKVLLTEICNIQSLDPLFIYLFILLAFTPTDILFHKFLEFYSILSEKKEKRFSSQIFLF